MNDISLTNIAQFTLGLPRLTKRAIALLVDGGLSLITLWLALSLQLESWVVWEDPLWWVAFTSISLIVPIFIGFGLYRAIFRYSGWRAMLAVVKAIALYGAIFTLIFTVIGVSEVPRSIGVIQPLLLLVSVGGSRVLVRYWLGGLYRDSIQRQKWSGVLIYGAGSAGRQLQRALSMTSGYRPLGYLDDDPHLQGQLVDGWRVYSPEELPDLIEPLGISDLLLAMPSMHRSKRMERIEWLRQFPLHVRTLPSVSDLAAGRVTLSDLHELDIEDLLVRDPVTPNGILINRNTHNKVVLVTGAGGSIGSELCRQILNCSPKRLLLVDNSEYALYEIHQSLLTQLESNPTETELVPLLASVQDEMRIGEIMDTWSPYTVYHAAAYKHVPMVEHNPAEGVRNNVWGTWVCAKMAALYQAQHFVLISTDKAVRPTNVMGASKRLAEMVLQAMSVLNPADLRPGMPDSRVPTCFSMVRFGNVLGSSGSVVPKFRQQIRDGGPVTLTHADITRFFMTIPESAQLVIQASAMATGGDVFVLDMGQPVRIYDLARRMVELSGLTVKDQHHPEGDIEIEITRLRPGEKLYEELLIGNDPKPTQHPRIMKAHEKMLSYDILQEKLSALEAALSINDVPLIRLLLQEIVSDYIPSSNVVDLVHLEQNR
ncbi:MAG: polysaccharide biosynthesis protein [Gammaproteobacteria bacterium]|nr:polysaccharide biosynthesis protein [Gammaproteobacteria bacterium]